MKLFRIIKQFRIVSVTNYKFIGTSDREMWWLLYYSPWGTTWELNSGTLLGLTESLPRVKDLFLSAG